MFSFGNWYPLNIKTGPEAYVGFVWGRCEPTTCSKRRKCPFATKEITPKHATLSKLESLLLREDEQTAREGSRHASPLHGTRAVIHSALQADSLQCWFKVRCKSIEPLRSFAILVRSEATVVYRSHDRSSV